MADPLRWGILGTGNIAGKFAAQLEACDHSQLIAVGSRRAASAEQFAQKFNCLGYDNYPQLLSDDQVEAIYVSLPNSLHCEWTLRALEAGKHVLCEKPLANSAVDAEQMFAAASEADRTLAEAFMYRCHPAVKHMLTKIAEGAIGEVRIIRTNFTYNRAADPNDVRYQRRLGGGALLDIGCYCVNLIQAITGQRPAEVAAVAHFHDTGVDDYTAATLRYDCGILASLTCGMCVEADRTTFINGTEGYIQMETPWFSDGTYKLVQNGQVTDVTEGSRQQLYALEAAAFGRAARGEEPIWMPQEETLRNMQTLDNIRAAIGLRLGD